MDNPHQFYTNLDFISGKVILNLVSDETIAAIVVKLEGEGKTSLIKPPPQTESGRSVERDRNRIAMENHKILYKIQTVFPTSSHPVAAGQSFTLRAGHHEYPFRFKIPFNNMCGDRDMQNVGMGLGGRLGLLDMPLPHSHVKKALPPSLSGFPGEAEIKYYVKVTVQRPSIWKENRRSAIGFKFMPIEPPRPPHTNAEAFARREHTFKAMSYLAKRKGLFSRQPSQTAGVERSVVVDARLPSPSIIVCRESLPMRLIIKKQNDSPEQIFLLGLEVDLIGTTNVRAQNVVRDEQSLFPVLNLHGLAIPIGKPGDKSGTESIVDDTLWNSVPLPPTVTPSFSTCNLSRTYHLAVRVTIGFGSVGDINVNIHSFHHSLHLSPLSCFRVRKVRTYTYWPIQPQTAIIPVRFPVEVYSGIKPPPELVAATQSRPIPQPTPSTPQAPLMPPRPRISTANTGPAAPVVDPLYPPQMGTAHADLMEDAPPSYEDAMADDIGPLNGRRAEYSGVADESSNSEVNTDSGGKGGLSNGAVPGYSANDPNRGGAGPSNR